MLLLVTIVVYDNFQGILVPGSYIQCSREYNKFLKSVCLFMQVKQQTSGHNNIPLPGVKACNSKIVVSASIASMLFSIMEL